MRDWFRLSARVLYWRRRARRAERQLVEVSAQAQAEYYRNMMREDTFVSAAVLGGRGMIGLSPRTGPAELPQPRRLTETSDPWAALTGVEKMEFQTQWLPAGTEKGLPLQRIRQDFLTELANRKSFMDEPSM